MYRYGKGDVYVTECNDDDKINIILAQFTGFVIYYHFDNRYVYFNNTV